MAELKYDLLLHPTNKQQVIHQQPWYKERLRTHYIKSLKPSETSKFLNGKDWVFLKDGLDDFRDGLPPDVQGDVFLKGSKGLSPNLKGSSDSLSTVKQPAVYDRFTRDQVCFSRITPQQQQRREHIDEIEYGLTQHPLALYPHLEECLPPDVFEDVVDILDPEMNLLDEEDQEDYFEEEEEYEVRIPEETKEDDEQPQDQEEGRVRNPYRWLPRKEEKEKKDRKKTDKRPSSPSEDEHIKTVTKEFCDWVADLGGENNNIEESTIHSLFASGYETKPALSVPIHVVELTNVPPELRMSATVPQQEEQKKNLPDMQNEKPEWKYSGGYQPSWVKYKYGAWYLPAKQWHRMDRDEPLRDPKELKDQEMSEAKKKSNNLDTELAPMHGAKAFMDFIDKKNNRRPEFLDRVANIQQEQAAEEQARIETEQAKLRKSNKRSQQSSSKAS